MVKQMCFVVDIDGTVANCEHRRHFVRNKPANWNAFNSLMGMDKPILPVIEVVESIANSGIKIVFLSGREGTKKNTNVTLDWLRDNIHLDFALELHMRKENDYRSDEIVKLELMQEFVEPHYEVIGIFDDRKKVVDMWRKNGYFVFDVNQSGEEF